MVALASPHARLPRSPDGTVQGIALSVLAHAALLAALAYGVSWRSPAPETIAAELWAAVPQTAAPPMAEPPPAPAPTPAPAPAPKPEPVVRAAPPPAVPDPQIAIEKARQERLAKARLEREEQARKDKLARDKLEREQAERERQAKEKQAAARKEAAQKAADKTAEDARQARIREDNIRRMMGQIGPGASAATGTTGTAAVSAGPSASYGGRLIGAIKPNIVFTETVAGNPAAVVEVRATATGTIVGRTLVKPSGVKEWDEAVLRAIDRTAKLPPDTDGRVPATLSITFRPRD